MMIAESNDSVALLTILRGNQNAQNGKWLCNASDVLRYAKAK